MRWTSVYFWNLCLLLTGTFFHLGGACRGAGVFIHFMLALMRLYAILEDDSGELSEEMKKFVEICELLIDDKMFAKYRWCGNGRPPISQVSLFKAYILKAMRNYPYTKTLIVAVRESPTIRRLCGRESVADIPDKSQFSRMVEHFALKA